MRCHVCAFEHLGKAAERTDDTFDDLEGRLGTLLKIVRQAVIWILAWHATVHPSAHAAHASSIHPAHAAAVHSSTVHASHTSPITAHASHASHARTEARIRRRE